MTTIGKPHLERVGTLNRVPTPVLSALRWLVAAVALWVVVSTFLTTSAALVIHGASIGALYGILAVGLILIYRTHRVINFAAAGIGAAPAVLGLILITSKGAPFALGAVVAIGGGLAAGMLTDVAVMKRFESSPRLVATVATVGVSQLMAGIGLLIAAMLIGSGGQQAKVATPWSATILSDAAGRPVLTGDQLAALVVVACAAVGLQVFLRWSRSGAGLRAASENVERARMLGVPVGRLHSIAWAIAGVLGALTIFLRAPLTGIPVDGTLGPGILLYALATAALARFSDLPTALGVGVAIGIVEQATVAKTGTANLSYALMLGAVLVALALHRSTIARAFSSERSSWAVARPARPVPLALQSSKPYRTAKAALVLGALAVALVAPSLFSTGDLGNLTLLPIFAIVAVSVVILTGWAGQVTYGQFGLVGVGAAVGGGLAANHGIDFTIALLAGIVAGALLAALIGTPAVRSPGIYLAVVTMAFAGAMEFYFLDRRYTMSDLGVLPGSANRIERPVLLNRIDLADNRSFYYLTVVMLVLAMAAAYGLRRRRSGRVFIGTHDNPSAAATSGINPATTRLAAFSISGGIAAGAGVLLAYQQQAVDPSTYGIGPSVEIFILTVIGGTVSVAGAVIATVVVEWIRLFGSRYLFDNAHLLVTGPGLLALLMFFPGGVGELLDRSRQRAVHLLARRAPIGRADP
ncbi:MAG: ABC transporter permease subunit [Microthrixaceae bacterium]